jgi:aspartate aminotransferase
MAFISEHFQRNKPSPIRIAQIEFLKRIQKGEKINEINVAIGNVSLPMHPAMIERLKNLDKSSFKDGVVMYTPTAGTQEANQAFKNILQASSIDTKNLYFQIVDGGSAAMELAIIGTTKDDDPNKKPLLLIEPIYANYISFAARVGKKVVCISRILQEDGTYRLPSISEIEKVIQMYKPGAIVVIPYDNPTGQFIDFEQLKQLASLAVKYDMWIISDEAYRELHYNGKEAISIWKLTNKDVPGIEGRRISIESSSKVWNACGLRIGALVTDNKEFHEKSVAEYTANLCANAIGQHIIGALAHLKKEELQKWFEQQRNYYKKLIFDFQKELKKQIPDIIISKPDSSLYSVIDVKKLVQDFDAMDFVLWCAKEGSVKIDSNYYTLLIAPMEGFYSDLDETKKKMIKTQMRIAYVLPQEKMKLVPVLLKELLEQYKNRKNK